MKGDGEEGCSRKDCKTYTKRYRCERWRYSAVRRRLTRNAAAEKSDGAFMQLAERKQILAAGRRRKSGSFESTVRKGVYKRKA